MCPRCGPPDGPKRNGAKMSGIHAQRRRVPRLAIFVASLLIVLCAGAWALCIMSYCVEWSVFAAGTPVRFPGATQDQRDETHYMFGRGRAVILSIETFTASINTPVSDLNSHALGWAVMDTYFPSRWSIRCYR